ncbi:MAG: thiamine pyrophosphate-binding protein [Betaproteobacteria bacterium]|nr:thiamine pyrophosphate-binding protein [Betaproteobacteria bacterium]
MDTTRASTAATRSEAPDGHQLIAAGLEAHGITHVFAIGGTPIHETLAACLRHGIRIVGVHHQQAAAMMAASYNYMRGRLSAAVILSAGPAIANSVTGVLVAHDNDWPLLVIGGGRPLDTRGRGAFQDLDAVSIVGSITRFAARLDRPEEIVPALDRACRIATGSRPGPAYLDISEDALNGRATAGALAPSASPAAPEVDRAAVARAAALLTQARRPALLVGGALRWSAPFDALAQLVDRLDLPFAASPAAQGYLPDDHRLCFSTVRARMLSTADVVLVAGATLDWTFRFGAEIRKDATLIVLGVDERGPGGLIPPTTVIDGDPGAILSGLVRALGPGPAPATPSDHWRAELAAARAERARTGEDLERDARVPMSEHRLIAEVRRFLPCDAIFVIDGNRILETAQQRMPSQVPVSRLTPGKNGCMGVGLPFGIGAKLAHPDRMVVVVTGDFAFGLNAMEMETAVRLRVPILVVVSNNDGNGGGRSERKFYPGHADRVTIFQPGIRYEEIVRAFGGHGALVEDPDDLVPALEQAAASGVAACLNVRVRTHDA